MIGCLIQIIILIICVGIGSMFGPVGIVLGVIVAFLFISNLNSR